MSPTEFIAFLFLLFWFGMKAVFKVVSIMADLTDWGGSFRRLFEKSP